MRLGLAHWPGKPIEPKDTEFPISSIIKCDPQALSDQQGRNSMTVVSHRELSISSPVLQCSDGLKIVYWVGNFAVDIFQPEVDDDVYRLGSKAHFD